MNWKILNKSFLADSRKCSVTAAAITAGATLAGSGISAASVAGHSHQNRVLARWQTEKQYQLAQEQMAAQKEMYHHSVQEQRYIDERNRLWQLADVESERAYNDPKAVAARLKAAGINPALAMQGGAGSMLAGSGYNSPSMPSPSSAPTGSVSASATPVMPPETRPYDLGAGVSQAIQDFMSMIGLESDVQRKNVQNENESALAEANIRKLAKDGLLSEASRDKLLNDLYEARNTFSERSRGLELQNKQLHQDIALKATEELQIRFNMKLEKQHLELKRKLTESEIGNLKAAMAKMYTEAKEMIANGASQRSLNRQLKLVAREQKDKLRQETIHQENVNAIETPEVKKSRQRSKDLEDSNLWFYFDTYSDELIDKAGRILKSLGK